MRFLQLKRNSNVILRKKMYKSGKSWAIKSTLSLMGGLALLSFSQGNVVKADSTATGTPVSQATAEVVTQGQEVKKDTSDTVQPSTPPETPTVPDKETPEPTEERSADNSDTPEQSTTGDEGSKQPEPQTPVENDKSVLGTNWSISADGNLKIENGTLNEMTDGVSPWTDAQKQSVNKITFGDQVTAGKSVAGLFQNFSNVTEFNNTNGFKTGATNDMSNLFSGCSSLTDIDLSGLDFSNATNLKNMFYGDKSLSSLELPEKFSNNVSDKSTLNFTGMFSGDSKLESLDLTPLDMSGTTNTNDLLSGDSNLVMLTLSGKDKLTDLNVGARNNRNISKGYTGWITSDDGMTSTSTGISTNRLVDMYDGKEANTGSVVWANHIPYIISVYEEDTNKKLLNSFVFYLPVGDSTFSSAYFEKKFDELSESKKLITSDDDSLKGSYLESSNLSGKVPLTRVIVAQFPNYEKDIVESEVKNTVDYIQKNIYDMNSDGSWGDFYFVYPSVPETHTSSSAPDREVQGIEERVGTFYDKPDVQLYDDSGSELTDRKLVPNSDWFTDESMSLGGVKYYRVATNEWTKAKDVYLYYPDSTDVLVNRGNVATLVTAEGKTVTDRALQANSGWYTDRYIYVNNAKYYRVATNEFVSADDVEEY
ncbi:SLAP domain-containing protein [Companilactobacillus muriivasis]|uniref:SLAP domain-containing protein n=1 Tax=Companilactobacillus muriivasis TaxID=3081444 RepID=UPI0030C6A736